MNAFRYECLIDWHLSAVGILSRDRNHVFRGSLVRVLRVPACSITSLLYMYAHRPPVVTRKHLKTVIPTRELLPSLLVQPYYLFIDFPLLDFRVFTPALSMQSGSDFRFSAVSRAYLACTLRFWDYAFLFRLLIACLCLVEVVMLIWGMGVEPEQKLYHCNHRNQTIRTVQFLSLSDHC